MGFKPIADYGFIGNLASCALVAKDGAIDWCCLPYLDSPSVFAAILDPEKGGTFWIQPTEEVHETKQSYVGDTNILRTVFTTTTGILEVIDWMHMGTFTHKLSDELRLPLLYRLVRCTGGTVEVSVLFDPRFDYARGRTVITQEKNRLKVYSPKDHMRLFTNRQFEISEKGAAATFQLKRGEEESFICAYGRISKSKTPPAKRSFKKTEQYWHRWISECEEGECPFMGRWHQKCVRSSVVLKVLAGGHGVAAAATTSLPEIVGGSDNWDYRFNWIRDTSFTIQALTTMGHRHDAREFVNWICEVLGTEGRRPADLRILYPLYGTSMEKEEGLLHLRGYRDSRPVRIGNAAALQRQHDIYGELLETIYRTEDLHPDVDSAVTDILITIVDYVCDIWPDPDAGIWELRGGPRHYVYSKVMCSVALDRGIKLAEKHHWKANLGRWKSNRDDLNKEIMEKGYDEERGSFLQSYGSEDLDATALLFPVLEFIEPQHPYALNTLETIQRELCDGALVYRSSYHKSREAAFGLCSFWLVDALAMAGRLKEAEQNFRKLLGYANHVGLFAEEIDPKSGEMLGNFPQAFTHVGLINSAAYLGRSRTTVPSETPLIGEKHLPGGEAQTSEAVAQ